ncbi:hypothetical protein BDZ97DRAFT_1761619 [Flammula alnicola]|nr:hypothetical protein BDZ97DRAFT_1761619 [Flammula alnicola]
MVQGLTVVTSELSLLTAADLQAPDIPQDHAWQYDLANLNMLFFTLLEASPPNIAQLLPMDSPIAQQLYMINNMWQSGYGIPWYWEVKKQCFQLQHGNYVLLDLYYYKHKKCTPGVHDAILPIVRDLSWWQGNITVAAAKDCGLAAMCFHW